MKTGGFMKNSFSIFVVCMILFSFNPQGINAQISPEAIKAFKIVNISLLTPQENMRNFTLPLLDGVDTSISDYKGKVVIVNLWATWCPPCREEMPSLEILYQRFKNDGLEILTVDGGEDDATVRRFIRNNNFTFPVLMDRIEQVNNFYGTGYIPTSYIIDREGKILFRIVGGIRWDTQGIFNAFDALLKSR
jgi:thiol-disulfide isomerase/thioredoxin